MRAASGCVLRPAYARVVTVGDDYTRRLTRLSGSRWKQVLGVQAPYAWNLRRLRPGRVLDVGCGLGRNLAHLRGEGVGVDHNPTSVAAARASGLTAFVPAEFLASPHAREGAFDSLLVAHVLEHLQEAEADELLETYLPFVKPDGAVIVITPQERGFASDPTHVRFVDAQRAQAHLAAAGVQRDRDFSFPFPRWAGRLFPYNEFVVVGRTPAAAS